MEISHQSTMDIVKDESRSDELPIAMIDRTGIGEILTRQAVAWCQLWLHPFPLKMTLNNVGLLTVLLAIMSPRPLIYRIIYPIFRLVFGTLYPAYASYKAVRTKNVKEYVKWMMYWIVFALFTCAETFTDVFFSFWFPFYYEIKIILVLWLLSPATKGSSILYRRFVHPALIRREAEIDEALARATEQGYTAVLHLGTKGVNYATTVLMQTAIKNLSVICSSATSSLPDRQSDPAISSLANPSSATRLDKQTDFPDGNESYTPCTEWSISDEDNHWLCCDEVSTTDSSEDGEADMTETPHAEESEDKSNEGEMSVFKTPEKHPPKKTRKSKKERVTAPTRQQKPRACRRQNKLTEVHDDDFSDADFNFAN